MPLKLISWNAIHIKYGAVQSIKCPTLCDPRDCTTLPYPSLFLKSLLKLTSNKLVMASNHLMIFHLLPSIFPQHQGLFQWVSSSHQVARSITASASVLQTNIQGWFPLGLTSLISLSKGLSRIFSNTIWKHQFLGIWPSLWSNSHICTWLLEKP